MSHWVSIFTKQITQVEVVHIGNCKANDMYKVGARKTVTSGVIYL